MDTSQIIEATRAKCVARIDELHATLDVIGLRKEQEGKLGEMSEIACMAATMERAAAELRKLDLSDVAQEGGAS